MVATQFIRVDMETKQALEIFKKVDREPIGEVVKRLIFCVLQQDEESLTEKEKRAILKSIIDVEKGRTQSFQNMIENIRKKRASKKEGQKENRGIRGDKDAMGD